MKVNSGYVRVEYTLYTPFNSSINRRNHPGIINAEIDLSNTANKSEIEFHYFVQKGNSLF